MKELGTKKYEMIEIQSGKLRDCNYLFRNVPLKVFAGMMKRAKKINW